MAATLGTLSMILFAVTIVAIVVGRLLIISRKKREGEFDPEQLYDELPTEDPEPDETSTEKPNQKNLKQKMSLVIFRNSFTRQEFSPWWCRCDQFDYPKHASST